MNAFEHLVGKILEHQGYWVRHGFKVNLTKSERRAIGRPSAPRWNLDIVAYRGADNQLLVVECKSYLYSRGVEFRSFCGNHERGSSRYKLFLEAKLRRTVFRRLIAQKV
jgi:hypothetical protein